MTNIRQTIFSRGWEAWPWEMFKS